LAKPPNSNVVKNKNSQFLNVSLTHQLPFPFFPSPSQLHNDCNKKNNLKPVKHIKHDTKQKKGRWVMKGKVAYPYLRLLTLLFFIFLTVSGCSSEDEQQSQPDYKETKQMVLDILQTEEGKKAIRDIMKDEKFKQEILLDEPLIRQTIQETMLQADNKEKWQQLMMDPKFIKEYAKQLEEQNKKIIKDLMKDPEYQASMMEVLKDPEMEKQFLELTKSKAFRQETMSVMKEALGSPYFRLELLQLLSQVAKENQSGQQGGQNQSGGQKGENQDQDQSA
jgi:spore germination protein D